NEILGYKLVGIINKAIVLYCLNKSFPRPIKNKLKKLNVVLVGSTARGEPPTLFSDYDLIFHFNKQELKKTDYRAVQKVIKLFYKEKVKVSPQVFDNSDYHQLVSSVLLWDYHLDGVDV